MSVCAIICEYNPLHRGHLWQIRQAKQRFDAVVCIMSGSFVQRGEPAIMDKFTRSRWALSAGADAVIELPAVYSLQSAEGFAAGGVRMAAALGATHLCFGSETEDTSLLAALAHLRLNEPDDVETGPGRRAFQRAKLPCRVSIRRAAVLSAISRCRVFAKRPFGRGIPQGHRALSAAAGAFCAAAQAACQLFCLPQSLAAGANFRGCARLCGAFAKTGAPCHAGIAFPSAALSPPHDEPRRVSRPPLCFGRGGKPPGPRCAHCRFSGIALIRMPHQALPAFPHQAAVVLCAFAHHARRCPGRQRARPLLSSSSGAQSAKRRHAQRRQGRVFAGLHRRGRAFLFPLFSHRRPGYRPARPLLRPGGRLGLYRAGLHLRLAVNQLFYLVHLRHRRFIADLRTFFAFFHFKLVDISHRR